MMQSGSLLEALTRKTRPPHDVRYPRPYADPEKAARRIHAIADAVEPIQGRIHIEKINEPFLFKDKATPAEHGAEGCLRACGPPYSCLRPTTDR
jgi:hypothetical protein